MAERPLHIGLVGPLPPPNGGMAMQTAQLARLLQREGMALELLSTNAPYRPRAVARVRGLRAVFRLLPYLFAVWRLLGRCQVVHLMANSGWSWQLFCAPVVWLGRLRATPVIVNYRGGEAGDYLADSLPRVAPTLHRASELVVPSGFLQDVFARHGFTSRVIPNIIDLSLFGPTPRRGRRGDFVFVVARNLEPIYGLDTALRALALARQDGPPDGPDIRLRIAGSGPQQHELQALARELGVDAAVSFLGRLSREQMRQAYAEADAMLNPSRVDNMPNSVLEAMACGLPVLATRVGGVPYIVADEKTALLVGLDDVQGMAQGMLRLAGDPSLCERLGRAAHAEVQQYGWDEVRPLWLARYRHWGAGV